MDVFLELSCFFHNPADVGNLISRKSHSGEFPGGSVVETENDLYVINA